MANTKEDIRKKLEGYVRDYDRKIELWQNVTVVTKKDGTEFANFGKNFRNAEVVNECGSTKLKVSEWSKDKYPNYVYDEIYLERDIKDWKYGEITEDRQIKPFSYSRPYFKLNVEETRLAIKDHIIKLMVWRQQNIEDLERLDEAYDYVESALEEIKTKLDKLAPPNGVYSSSLWYALQEKIKNFPY